MDELRSESELMQRIVARDQQALAEFYDQYSALVYGMAMRVLQNPSLAEEAAQDTFLKIWHQAERWDPQRGKIVTWLLTIARFTAIDRLLKEQRQTKDTAAGLDDVLYLVASPDVVDDAQWSDARLVRDLLQQLPQDQLQSIELAYFQGMSHSQIAQHLGQPLGTVKSRIRDGMRNLRGLWLQETK